MPRSEESATTKIDCENANETSPLWSVCEWAGCELFFITMRALCESGFSLLPFYKYMNIYKMYIHIDSWQIIYI